jgi:hypothetical protein
MSIGYMYIFSNPAMPGLLKIGFTNRDVKERLAELSSMTGVPKPFEIEYYYLTRDVEEIESTAHTHFSSKREQGKEFFSVALVEAVELIDSLVKNVEPDRFCSVAAKPSKPSIPEKGLGPDDRLCIDCGTINRDVHPVGLDREIICKKCGYLIEWGGGTRKIYPR